MCPNWPTRNLALTRNLSTTPVETTRGTIASPKGGERMTVVTQLGRLARLLSSKEVAAILQVHQETVYTLIRDEGLPSIRVGRTHRFDGALVANWIEQRST